MAREVIPLLEEEGWEQEEAARTLGEFGAVAVVSGNSEGQTQTQTLPLFVEDAYANYQTELAFGAAMVLGGVAIVSLLLKILVEQVLERDTRASRMAQSGSCCG